MTTREGSRNRAIVDAIATHGPMTAVTLSERLEMPLDNIRPRVTNLVYRGVLRALLRRRKVALTDHSQRYVHTYELAPGTEITSIPEDDDDNYPHRR